MKASEFLRTDRPQAIAFLRGTQETAPDTAPDVKDPVINAEMGAAPTRPALVTALDFLTGHFPDTKDVPEVQTVDGKLKVTVPESAEVPFLQSPEMAVAAGIVGGVKATGSIASRFLKGAEETASWATGGATEAAVGAAKGTKAAAKAISEEVAPKVEVKAAEFLKGEVDEVSKVAEPPKPQEPPPPTEGAPTGTRNAVTEAEREARGLDEIEKEIKRNVPTYEEAKTLVAEGKADPKALAQSIVEKPRPLSSVEEGILGHDRVRLLNEETTVEEAIAKAVDAGDKDAEAIARKKWQNIQDDLDINHKATTAAGTEWSASGRMRQAVLERDYTLGAMIRKHKVKTGQEPSLERVAAYEAMSGKIKELSAKLAEREGRIAELEVTKSVRKIEAEAAREARQARRAASKQELSGEFDSLVNDLKAAMTEQRGSFSLKESVRDNSAIIIGKMAKNRVQMGIVKAAEIVDSIHAALQKMGVELSKREIRDMISGYGKTSQLSKEEVAAQLREAKRQMRLISALEDAEKSKVPLRSGLQRDLPTDEVRELQRKVKEMMREKGIDAASTKTPAERWKTSLDAVKKRLENQIVDLEKRIKTGEKASAKKGIAYDTEAKVLQSQRNILKWITEITEGKPGMSAEQRVRRALSAAERSVKDLEARIAAKDIAPKKPTGTTPVTPELKAMREKRDTLRKAYQEMRKEAKPRKSPEEIALNAYKTRTSNRIKELEDKMARGDFAKKQKRTITMDKEALDLQFQREKVIQQYNKMVFEDQLKNRTLGKKIADRTMESVNLIRSIKTSMDLSAVLRQGAFIVLGHPVRGLKAMPDMFRALKSEKGQFAADLALKQRPNYKLYEQSKLYLSEHGQKLSQMEEAYMSRWVDKVPGVAASQRAYTMYLNRLRADSFDKMVATLARDAKNPTKQELEAIANYINVATGRGKIGTKESLSVGMNTILFAPRYVASRFQLLAGQPMYGGSLATRKMIAGEYARFLTGLAVVYGLGSAAGGKISFDPRSSDFGKIKFGNTRVDPLAGLSQSTVLLGRLGTGEIKTTTGKVQPIRGEKIPYGGNDAANVIARFLRSKLAPVPAIGVDVATGKNYVGEPIDAKYAAQQVLPLAFGDIYDTMREQGVAAGTALSILSIFGVGIQTYDSKKRR